MRQAIRYALSGDGKPLHRVAGVGRKTRAVLIVILDILRVYANLLAGNLGFLLGLVKVVLARENRESRGDGPIEEVRLRESELQGALVLAELRGEGKGFAQAEEVVSLIGEADKTAGETANTALQTDGLFALFLQLEIDVDGAVFAVLL